MKSFRAVVVGAGALILATSIAAAAQAPAQGGAAPAQGRAGQPPPPPKNLQILPKDIPPAERASREDIIRVSNMYFSNLQNNDGKGDYSFFADDCYRLENGIQTTSGPHPAPPRPAPAAGAPAAPARPGPNMSALGCKQGFATGFFRIVTRIRDRRFPLVDEQKGVAFAFAFFDHAGNVHDFPLSDGTISPGGIKAPFTWEIAEAFRIEHGKIKTVEAVLNNAPYGMKAGWDGK